MFAKLTYAILGMVLLLPVVATADDLEFGSWTVAATRSGYWVGAYNNYDATEEALLKYDNADGLVFAKPYGAPQGFNDFMIYRIVPLNDGGAIVVGRTSTGYDVPPPGYSLHRVDATGSPVWSLRGMQASDFPQDNFETTGSILLGVDNSGAVWFPANGHIYHVSSTGTLENFGQISASSNDVYPSTVDPIDGTLYFAADDDTNVLAPNVLLSYSTDGTKTTLWTAPDSATKLRYLALGNDGNLYAIGNDANTHIAMSFTPSGTVRWSTTFGSSLYAFSGPFSVDAQAAVSPDGTIAAYDTSGALFEISNAGQVTQIPDSAYEFFPNASTTVALASNGDVFLYQEQFVRLTPTGQVVVNRPLGADVVLLADDTVLATEFLPNGAIDLFHADSSGNAVNTFELIASLDTPAQIPVTQSGIAGAWYPEAEGGQGFTLDYIASAQTIFMPWFTYGTNATSDASGQAWITLQGTAAPGATSVDLVIARANPGVFNSGQEAVTQVGTAHLWFTDCSNGRLQYQFDENNFGGQGGLIPLTRLSPSTSTCRLADGSTSPAQNTNAPSKGFDARQSGSWFDPTTSGQGIQLTIIPAGATDNGLLFGAWFTFDEPPADDAAHEHWFTLQGDFENANAGVVTAPIVQTFGGSLDGAKGLSSVQVGTATLTMLSCDTATLNYQFDDSSAAGNFAALTGVEHLIKVGGCATQ